MKTVVSKTKFKPKAFEYMRRVEELRETIQITDHNRPVVEMVPCGKKGWQELDHLRGMVREYIDPLSPVDEDWDADR